MIKLDDWQRIEKIIRWAGLSANSFALNIGLSRGENIYQIKKGNHGISKELAEMITRKYPEISRGWLLTGEGEMFVGGDGERIPIPCFDVDAIYIAELDRLPDPSYILYSPRWKGLSFGAQMKDRSMEPEIQSGAILLLQEVRIDQIIPGHNYLIVSRNHSLVRRVNMEPGSERMRLVAVNGNFNDVVIETCEIRRILRVKAHIQYYQ